MHDTGSPMTMPVGENTLGHVFNVLGQALDDPDFQAEALADHPPLTSTSWSPRPRCS